MDFSAFSVAFEPLLREPGKKIYLNLIRPFLSSKLSISWKRVRYLTPFWKRTEHLLSRSIIAVLDTLRMMLLRT